MIKIFLLCMWGMVPVCLSAQTYNVLLIPDSLRKEARAIVRDEDEILEIKSPGKALVKRRQVLTILNERGDRYGGFSIGYSKFNVIETVSGTLYDAMGKEVRRVKKGDMDDRSYTAEGTLIDDYRYKAHDFNCRNYPYTVEYRDEEEFNGIIDFHDWVPLWAPGMSTQHSKYTIIAPKNYVVRYKLLNNAAQPVITETGDKKMYVWEASNMPARSSESNGPLWKDIVPSVLLAPSEFEVEGYKGNMSTWLDYGKFIEQLRKGRDVLPEDIKKKVHDLTDNLPDKRQKIFALYDFLQKNTHYIGIQLGIGGWQPFPVDYVATKRYGDCKALANYMIALLKEAGIAGKYVVIRGGRDEPPIVEDFPGFQFNHVVCCVPMEKDTVWLECTSQTESPDFNGSFTGGRKGLLVDETGGHLISTTSYAASDNLQKRVVSAEITPEGNLVADVTTTYTGEREERPRSLMFEISPDYREKYLNSLFNLPTYKVEKSQYEEHKAKIPVVKEYLRVSSPDYASVSGKRLFINPNLFDRSSTRLVADSARKYDFIDDEAFRDIDSITIKIPEGYKTEAVPQEINVNSKFGKYAISVKVLPDRIQYYRIWEESLNRFPPSDYRDLAKFYEQIYKSDHSRVVLVKKE